MWQWRNEFVRLGVPAKAATSLLALVAFAASGCGSGSSSAPAVGTARTTVPEVSSTTVEAEDDNRSSSGTTLPTSSPATSEASTTTAISPDDSDVPAETVEDLPAGEAVSVSDVGFVTFEAIGELWASAGAYVTNNTGEPLSFVEVTYNFLDEGGAPVATETDYITWLPADGAVPTFTLSTSDMSASPPATVEVIAFADDDGFFDAEGVELLVGDVAVVDEQFGTVIKGTVTNPSDASISFAEVRCILVTDDGSTVAGSSAYADRVAPGQTVAWETSGSELDAALANGATTATCRSFATLD